MTRKRAVKHSRGREVCDVYWGSHGCRKLQGHIGEHLCGSGCAIPSDGFTLYGTHALSPDPEVDRRLREERVGAPPTRPVSNA